MSNRTLFIFTGLIIAGLLVLLGFNMAPLFTKSPPSEPYLKRTHVKGMDIEHKQLLYTLNFNQQNDIVDILNRSVKVVGLKPGKRQKPDIEKIVIYQFGGPDLVLTPIAYVDNNLVFTVPEWEKNSYLMELSDGYFNKMITQTYDP